MSGIDDGTNDWGIYSGFANYFFPDTALVMTVSAMIIFMSFSTDVKKLCQGESTIKDFPILLLGGYLITSMFMFMFVFGNGTTDTTDDPRLRLLVDASTSLIESSTICLIGKMGYFVCMLWACFYVFYYFSNLKTSILAIVGLILGSFVIMVVLALILKIPLINRIIITVMFTAFNLIPGLELRKVLERRDTSFFNMPCLWGTFVLNSAVTLSFIKSMDIFGFQFIGFVVIINFLIVFGFIGLYLYLTFFEGDNNNQTNNENNNDGNQQNLLSDVIEGKVPARQMISKDNYNQMDEDENNKVVLNNFPINEEGNGPKQGEVTVNVGNAVDAYEPPDPYPQNENKIDDE